MLAVAAVAAVAAAAAAAAAGAPGPSSCRAACSTRPARSWPASAWFAWGGGCRSRDSWISSRRSRGAVFLPFQSRR